jgi:autophagy-related protein 9
MWSKRFTSTFLFESSFIEEKFYLKTEFINKLYYYYIHNGYYNIISSQIVNVLINIFTVFFVLLIFKGVDYNRLLSIDDDSNANLGDIINIQELFNLNAFSWMLLIVFLIYIFFKIVSIIDDYISFKSTKDFLQDILKIKDSQLSIYKWNDLIIKLKSRYKDEEIDAYYFSNKIMTKDNYFIGLIDKEIIKLDYLTKLLEWNLVYCIIMYLFDEDYKIRKDINHKKAFHIDRIKLRLRIVSLCNFLLMPFIFVFLIFSIVFEYSEKFYNSPKLLNTLDFTLNSQWKFRYYNELHHDFLLRMKDGNKYAEDYFKQFHSKLKETISKLIIFMLSSVFTILIFLSIINENVLLHLYVTPHKTVIWYIGIIVTLLTILKGLINDKLVFYPKEKMVKLRKCLGYFPHEYETSNDVDNIKDKIKIHYQYKVGILLKDIFYTLLIPFKLFELSFKVDSIVEFLQENTLRHNKIGRTFKLSLFDNYMGLENKIGDKKTIESFHNFKEHYDNWCNNINLTESMSII